MAEDIGYSRREFLKNSIIVLGGVLVAGLAIPSTAYFLSPLWKEDKASWVDLARVDEIPPGTPVNIDFVQRKKDGWRIIEGRWSTWVVTNDGIHFTAFDPRCTHLGCPYHWDTSKKQFICPCHMGIFAVDGEVLGGPPPRPLDVFPSKVEGGRLKILPTPVRQKA